MSVFPNCHLTRFAVMALSTLSIGQALAQTPSSNTTVSPQLAAPAVESTSRPAINPAAAASIRPDTTLQQQIQLQQLNAQVSKELERLNTEAQLEEARKTLQEKREGSMPEFLGTFRSPVGLFAEFRTGEVVQERKSGEFVTAEWRIAEIHSDRVRLCRNGQASCKTLTPSIGSRTVAK